MRRAGETVFPQGKAHWLVIQYQIVNPYTYKQHCTEWSGYIYENNNEKEAINYKFEIEQKNENVKKKERIGEIIIIKSITL